MSLGKTEVVRYFGIGLEDKNPLAEDGILDEDEKSRL